MGPLLSTGLVAEITLVAMLSAQAVTAGGEIVEQAGDGGMIDRLVAIVGKQILLADIGDVAALAVLGEQVIERLVLARAQIDGDRLIPFVAVGEHRIDIEDD